MAETTMFNGCSLKSTNTNRPIDRSTDQPGDRSTSNGLVAAIDLGTSYSGYAFSSASDPNDVFIFTNWGVNSAIPHSFKTPTCLLTDGDLEFVALGYEAKSRFSEMTEGDAAQHRFFEGFKMSLHSDKGITRATSILDCHGNPCPAIDIFAMMLRELRKHLLEQCELRNARAPNDRFVRWVVTVPAIWTDSAKQFMREAAVKGGLVPADDHSSLLIALEPEVASLYCRTLPLTNFATNSNMTEFVEGDKYIVVDAGGGTLDITAHEIHKDSQLAELYHANGGALGATHINDNFLQLLDRVFEEKFITAAQSQQPGVIIQLLHAFETSKRGVRPTDVKASATPVNMELNELYRELYNKPLQKSVRPEYAKDGVRISSGLLLLPHHVTMELFTPLIDEICTYVKNLLDMSDLQDVRTVLMVGGFSDCAVLQQSMRRALGDKYSVMIPNDAWSAVLKGAVMFGHQPDIVYSRRAKVTYGIEESPPYNPIKHDPKRVSCAEGKRYAKDVLKVWVEQGETLEKGFCISRTGVPIFRDQDSMDLDIFTSTNPEAKYTTDPGVEKVGRLTVMLPGCGLNRQVEISMRFGGTEIEVEARDVRDGGHHVKTTVDFLS